jgi:hypothetical protein
MICISLFCDLHLQKRVNCVLRPGLNRNVRSRCSFPARFFQRKTEFQPHRFGSNVVLESISLKTLQIIQCSRADSRAALEILAKTVAVGDHSTLVGFIVFEQRDRLSRSCIATCQSGQSANAAKASRASTETFSEKPEPLSVAISFELL